MIDSPATIPYFTLNKVLSTMAKPPKLTFIKKNTGKSTYRTGTVMDIKQQILNNIANAAITLGISLSPYVGLT